MEEEGPSIKLKSQDSKISKTELKNSAIKISLTTLYHLFGRNSYRIYNYFNKKQNLEISPDCSVMQDTKIMFENKAKGFYMFVDKFVEKFKNIKKCKKVIKQEKKLDYSLEFKKLDKHPSKSRYLLTKRDEIFRLKETKAIILQKNIRRYIAYQNFLKIFNENLKARIIQSVIIIQKNFRKFSTNQKFRIYYLKYKIFTTLQKSKHHIKNTIQKYYSQTSFKKRFLLHYIIDLRTNAIKQIQNRIKFYLFYKKVKNLLLKEKTHYFLSYPFVANEVKLMVYINKRQHINSLTYKIEEKIYKFEFCKIRNIFVLHINPEDFKPGKYRVKMIVDNLVTCDGRFPHIEFSDGYYYNIIDFSVKNGKTKDTYYKSLHYSNTREDTHESEIKKENMDNNSDKSVREYSNSCSSRSFVKELRKKRTTSFDLDLKENLENKKAYSYLELIKESLLNDSSSIDNNFD